MKRLVHDRATRQPLRLLDHISLVIRPKEFVCLLGPSGSGKSTLLAILSGRSPPNTGAVTLNGGVFYGVCPGRAEFGIDLRIPPGVEKADVQAAMDRWIEGVRAGDPQLEIDWAFERAPLDWIPPTEIATIT